MRKKLPRRRLDDAYRDTHGRYWKRTDVYVEDGDGGEFVLAVLFVIFFFAGLFAWQIVR